MVEFAFQYRPGFGGAPAFASTTPATPSGPGPDVPEGSEPTDSLPGAGEPFGGIAGGLGTDGEDVVRITEETSPGGEESPIAFEGDPTKFGPGSGRIPWDRMGFGRGKAGRSPDFRVPLPGPDWNPDPTDVDVGDLLPWWVLPAVVLAFVAIVAGQLGKLFTFNVGEG